MARLPISDIVVLLPGITGSRLTRDGKPVWDLSLGAVGAAVLSRGQSVTDLELTEDDPEQEYLDDGVREAGVLPDLHFLPGLDWRIDGYGKIAQRLHSWFDLTPGRNYFEFAYDWRRDNRAHAKRLRRQSRDWLRTWRDSTGNQQAKLILIAHSMGGLISRYFLECTEDGWRDTRLLVTFGTPYNGSLNAVDGLANGFVKKLGPLTLIDLTAAMRSWRSVYQLLPTFRSIDNGSAPNVHLRDGLLPEGFRADAFAATTEFHDAIEAGVRDHRQTDYDGTGGYDVRPIVGEFQRTFQSATLGPPVTMLPTWRGTDGGGDGTVPALSSYPKEQYENRDGVTFVAEQHASLQNNDAVLTQLHGLLRGQPIPAEEYLAGLGRAALDLPLGFESQEPLHLDVRSDQVGSELDIRVATADDDHEVGRSTVLVQDEDWRTVELPPVPPGDYRVTVGGSDIAPVTDICTVLPPTLPPPTNG
jgi:hypothetical protein